jgi:hypothetical protein
VLYDTLLHLGYNGDIPIYHCYLSMAHGLDSCEVNVMITLDPMAPWMGTVVGSKLDSTIEQTTHVALTSLCGSRLTTTVEMPMTMLTAEGSLRDVKHGILSGSSMHHLP